MKFDLNDINFDWARNIWEDLKNKHLLPVVALLVVALIAVPFLLGGHDDPPPADTIAVSSSDASSPKLDPIAVKESRPNGQDIGGEPTNPFKQPGGGGSSTTQTTAAAPATGSSTTSTAPATGSTGTSTTETKSESTKSNDPSSAYKIDVKLGAPDKTTSKKNIAALTPLPSADDAYVVYLGAKDSGKTAVFLISTDVKATGDGICDPSKEKCKTVEMTAGDTETFQLQDATGMAVGAPFELKVTKIHK